MKIPERDLAELRRWMRRVAGYLSANDCPRDRAAKVLRSKVFAPRDLAISQAAVVRNPVDVLRDDACIANTMSRMINDAVNEVYGRDEP